MFTYRCVGVPGQKSWPGTRCREVRGIGCRPGRRSAEDVTEPAVWMVGVESRAERPMAGSSGHPGPSAGIARMAPRALPLFAPFDEVRSSSSFPKGAGPARATAFAFVIDSRLEQRRPLILPPSPKGADAHSAAGGCALRRMSGRRANPPRPLRGRRPLFQKGAEGRSVVIAFTAVARAAASPSPFHRRRPRKQPYLLLTYFSRRICGIGSP
jgi:hypothetical protein